MLVLLPATCMTERQPRRESDIWGGELVTVILAHDLGEGEKAERGDRAWDALRAAVATDRTAVGTFPAVASRAPRARERESERASEGMKGPFLLSLFLFVAATSQDSQR